MGTRARGRRMPVIENDRIVIVADGPRDLASKLEFGVKSLFPRAKELGDRGILVTRASPSDFVIELDPSIPFGETLEHCRWRVEVGTEDETQHPSS